MRCAKAGPAELQPASPCKVLASACPSQHCYMTVISVGTLGHHLLYGQEIRLLIAYENSHMETRAGMKIPKILHGYWHPIPKTQSIFVLPSH